MNSITVTHNAARHRFELFDGGKAIGKASYREYQHDGSPQRIFHHTVVSDDYSGQGLGATLAKEALDATMNEGIGIVPVCKYIRAFLRKHPEYKNSTVAVSPDHLTFLESAARKA